ncbi:pyridoxal-dependent decarboxylase domain protein (macronuclear) [Tetrahymena thermophila SB210]|uniref:sphinganine-1-phosphate aldolase n=1 Tax=Tetrahymena thermophila (strain SB210) TaxID=312017 RepID=Q22UE1_TETTS|nr:pyridoxal-dependent decarboxylase domain protein [Tetrahymena thermophila SB210]EAR88746.1 pyridoxal-dependent decarboxylase domain protein [Tetrahymena thermophila SB210]|eukprot:XP_001008991.1 pyridoxal-dependent decarboxylase domain protein [Tetrahymena thermophila SB210]
MEIVRKVISGLTTSDLVEAYKYSRDHLYNIIHPFTHQYEQYFIAFCRKNDLGYFDQSVLLVLVFFCLIMTLKTIYSILNFIFKEREVSLKAQIFKLIVTYVPFAKKELEKSKQKLEHELEHTIDKYTNEKCPVLNDKGMNQALLQKRFKDWIDRDDKLSGSGKISGSRYGDDRDFEKEVSEFAKGFLYHNPMHYDIFPATRQMEAEIIKMTCNLFGSNDGYGFTTTGGTESIMMGVLAHRNYAAKYRKITEPNIVMPVTAHPAFNKACNFFKVKCIRVPVNKDSVVEISEVKKRIDSNTIMLVGSVPNFPHGTIDPIPQLAKLAKSKGIGLHVDCCLGGFVVAFAKDYNLDIPPFDFTVDGVTSISCDHHKYGLAPKGVSVCMFKTLELRHSCYTSLSDWPGGFYATPSVCGSKAGAPIAGAWYAMQYHGKQGYIEKSKSISGCVKQLVQAIKESPELQEIDVIGNPKTVVVAIVYKKGVNRNIYHLEGALSQKGWAFAGVQRPAAIHISITHGIANRVKDLIRDLKLAVKEVAENPEKFKNSSSSSIYGASVQVPDTRILDSMLEICVDFCLRL